LVLAIILLSRPDGSSVSADIPKDQFDSAQFAVAEPFRSLGSLSMAAGPATFSFELKNETDTPLRIDRITTSCMCTEATLEYDNRSFGPFGMPGHGFSPRISETIPSGESATVKVTFDPAAHGPSGVGPIQRDVFVESGDTVTTLGFSATVTP